MTTWITICDTCKREGAENRAEDNGHCTDGETLAALIEENANGDVRTRRFSCLMGCSRACNVSIQAHGKIAYSLGEFTPDRMAAEAILCFARLHAESRSGQVPYRQWPEGVRGHFVSRHPPLIDAE